jgi:hypothetical protein
MKKKKAILLTILTALFLSGCLVKSIHPFYQPEDRVFRTELLGTWQSGDSTLWEFSQTIIEKFLHDDSVDMSYSVKLTDLSGKEEESWFRTTLFQLGDATYLDFSPLIEQNIGDNFASFHFIPAHSVARVEFFGDGNFALNWFDEEWLSELFEKNRIKISHEVIRNSNGLIDESYILTASTSELQKFLSKYGEEFNIFGEIDREMVMEGSTYEEIFQRLNKEIEKNLEKDAMTGYDGIFSNLRKISD